MMTGNESDIKEPLEELLERLSEQVKAVPPGRLQQFALGAIGEISQIVLENGSDSFTGGIKEIVDTRYIGDEGSVLIDTYDKKVYVGGINAGLSPYKYKLLLHLMRNSDRVVPNQELLEIFVPKEAVPHYDSASFVKSRKRDLRIGLGTFKTYIRSAPRFGTQYTGPVSYSDSVNTTLRDYDPNVSYGYFSIGKDGIVSKKGVPLNLPRGGYASLRWLIENPQKTLTPSQIEQFLSHRSDRGNSLPNYISQIIRDVRIAIGDDPTNPKYLLKVNGGYKLGFTH